MGFNLGLVGHGFVGLAVETGFQSLAPVRVYDKFKDTESLESVVDNSDIIFVCVPTPMDENGACDSSIVEEVVEAIIAAAEKTKTIIIKSTVEPGTTARLSLLYSNHLFVFSPEYLTEKNFINDFLEQNRIVLGYANNPKRFPKERKRLIDLFEAFTASQLSSAKIVETGSTTAEMSKYVANCFLATKVTFFNEIKEICDEVGIDFDEVVDTVLLDERIGKSHCRVPGFDGKKGFGGSCLVPSSKVITRSGLKNIGDIERNDFIFDGQKFTLVTSFGKRVVKETVKLIAKGRSIEGSLDHIHMVNRGGKMEETLLKDVCVGDMVYVPRPILPEISEVCVGEKPNNYVKFWKNSFFIDECFARLIGLYLAEGFRNCYRKKGGGYSYEISWIFGPKEEGLADEIVSTLKEVGLNVYKYFKNSENATFGPSNTWCVRCRSQWLYSLFDVLGVGYNSHNKVAPFFHPRLNKAMVGGWLEGDGNKYKNTISGYSESKDLIRSMDAILLSLGICSSVKNEKTINISCRKDVERVCSWVNRFSFSKEDYVREFAYKSPNTTSYENGWLVSVSSVVRNKDPKVVISLDTDSNFYVADFMFTHNCFPKDLNALTYFAEELGLDPILLGAVWAKNLLVREDYEWEGLAQVTGEYEKE